MGYSGFVDEILWFEGYHIIDNVVLFYLYIYIYINKITFKIENM